MARLNNMLTDGSSGAVGRTIVFRRRKSGKMIMAKHPGRRTTPPTDQQREIQERFKEASIYARAVVADANLKALYEAVVRDDQSAFNLALRDAFKSPVIKSIDTSEYSGKAGNTIKVRATDDFKVASVNVSVCAADGSVIERGEASLQSNGLDWLYTATVASDSVSGASIIAIAKDLPGNAGKLEIKL